MVKMSSWVAMKTLPRSDGARPERLPSRLLYGIPAAGGSRMEFASHPGPGDFYGLKGTKHKRPRTTAGALPIYRVPAPLSSAGLGRLSSRRLLCISPRTRHQG